MMLCEGVTNDTLFGQKIRGKKFGFYLILTLNYELWSFEIVIIQSKIQLL